MNFWDDLDDAFDSASDWVDGAVDSTVDWVNGAVDTVEDGFNKVGDDVKEGVAIAAGAVVITECFSFCETVYAPAAN